MNTDGRVIVWFSCGAASACAAWLAVQKYPDCEVVYCDTMSTEHEDQPRFFADVERWIGKTITKISSAKYATVDEVFEKTRYMAGPQGARCTLEMKKFPRFDYERPADLHVFGFTANEAKRIREYEEKNPDMDIEWILRDEGLSKEDCYRLVQAYGIELPEMYKLGFKNNNCIGCVKSTSPDYWNRTRQHFPDVFDRRVRQSRNLGVRLVQIYQKKRIFLDDLPIGYVGGKPEEDIDCGVICTQETA